MNFLLEWIYTYTDHTFEIFHRKFTAKIRCKRQAIENPCSETEKIDQSFDITWNA